MICLRLEGGSLFICCGLSLCLSVCLLCTCLSCLSLSLSLSPSVPPSLPLCVPVSLTLSHTLSLSLTPLSLSVSLSSMLRAKIPKLSQEIFNSIFPSDSTITAVQKSHGVHKIYVSEVATQTHWFSLLKQPMMIIVWCHDWEDASKFQYLMQILQVQFNDYVPRYQIFMFDDSKIYKSIQQWQEPLQVGMVNRFLGSWQRRFSMIYK